MSVRVVAFSFASILGSLLILHRRYKHNPTGATAEYVLLNFVKIIFSFIRLEAVESFIEFYLFLISLQKTGGLCGKTTK